jgi:hypothetical protein
LALNLVSVSIAIAFINSPVAKKVYSIMSLKYSHYLALVVIMPIGLPEFIENQENRG